MSIFQPEQTETRGRGRDRDRDRRPAALGPLFEKQPPQSPEAEMALLGAMVLDPRVIVDVMQIVRGPEAFYADHHAAIYASITELYDRTSTVDLVLLLETLRDKRELEAVGGTAYLEKLAAEAPPSVNAPHFAKIVADKYKLRKLIDAAGTILFETYQGGQATGEEAKKLIDAAEQRIFEIAQEEDVSQVESLSELLSKEYDRLIAIDMGQNADMGVLTGYHDLDRDLGGLQRGEMLILAARPSMGKTALVLNIAEQIALGTDQPASTHAVREGVPIGVFSLEMSKSSLSQRLLSSWSGISSQKIRSGQLSKRPPNDEYALLLAAAQQLGTAPIYIDDTPGLTLMAMRARARRMVAQHKVRVIMIDYLQLLSSPAQARESRQVEVSAISRGIKALARELQVPIIALSQLNRGPEGRDGNRPRLSDLRESGSLEQDADVVLLLHREEYYHIQDPEWQSSNPDKIGLAELIIAKQRNGPTGVVKLTWDSTTTRFKNHAEAVPYEQYGAKPASQAQTPANPFASAGNAGAGGVPMAVDDSMVEADPFASPPPTAPRGGWHSGRMQGPVENHRDGGGPDRDDDEPAPF